MNNKIISVVVVLILIVGGVMIFQNSGVAPTETDLEAPIENDLDDTQDESAATVKEFSIEAGPFYFAPKTMTVNKGDTVKITVKNVKGTHDLKIDEFNAATRTLNAEESQTITFVADKAGSFEYYCSIGTHRAMGMVGTLTVR